VLAGAAEHTQAASRIAATLIPVFRKIKFRVIQRRRNFILRMGQAALPR
jgi:hypothetical protein